MIRTLFLKSARLLASVLSLAGAAHASDVGHAKLTADSAWKRANVDVRTAALWVAANADNQRLPFVVIDKKNAQIFVFGVDHQLKGVSPVLLGLALGDDGLVSMVGRDVSSLRPSERTTPAGRYAAEPGHNLRGEAIVWLDYDAQLAIHRLRPDAQHERRAHRLATPNVHDNRISLGCVVVPVAFYENVIGPMLGSSRSVVYVLPETRPLMEMLSTLQSGVH